MAKVGKVHINIITKRVVCCSRGSFRSPFRSFLHFFPSTRFLFLGSRFNSSHRVESSGTKIFVPSWPYAWSRSLCPLPTMPSLSFSLSFPLVLSFTCATLEAFIAVSFFHPFTEFLFAGHLYVIHCPLSSLASLSQRE